MTSDAHHLTQPTVDGPARAMRAALREAGLAARSKSATSTPTAPERRETIPTETRAIREVFGAHADKLAVSSTKSMHGHALGAAGALEAIATVLALHHGILPPTANYNERDPECDLDYIPNQPRAARVEAALSNSFAFGGLNAVVAFRAEPDIAAVRSQHGAESWRFHCRLLSTNGWQTADYSKKTRRGTEAMTPGFQG